MHIAATSLQWEAIGPRIIQVPFKTSNAKVGLKVIQCYAPTNDKEERIKEL
jgi:hypothetical protein